MTDILHDRIPDDIARHARLPGVQPLADGRWLRTDEAYAGQMAYRRHLLAERRETVLWPGDGDAQEAARETLNEAQHLMPQIGFDLSGGDILCPDGTRIDPQGDHPLAVLGQVVQEDICVLEKRGAEHVLTAAVLCFPASWTLAEKAGRPLSTIHRPVDSYTSEIQARVQRLFDGVQVGRPMWRNNYLAYDDAELHQPRSEQNTPRAARNPERAPFLRAERQCILRLPQTRAVVFSIHTYVARRPGWKRCRAET